MSIPKILLVDDEVNILNALRRLLLPENLEIVATTSPSEAIQLASESEFAVIISDHRMPEMEGTVLLQRLKELSPTTVRIMLTGYADIPAATSAINEGEVYRFLPKPWDDEELSKLVKQAVERFESIKRQGCLNTENMELSQKNQELIATHAKQTVQNKCLHAELDRSYNTSISALAKSIKLYDLQVWQHSIVVKRICQKVAKFVKLSYATTLQLEVAGLLHDIGKVGVSHTILKRPVDLLNPQERKIYENHPLDGYNVLNVIPYFQEASVFIRDHHEHFDGTGFPGNLKGKDISAGARLLAVLDAFAKLEADASLTMDNSCQQALNVLEAESGKRFDPNAIHILKKCIAFYSDNENELYQQEALKLWHAMEPAKAEFTSKMPLSQAESFDLSAQIEEELLTDDLKDNEAGHNGGLIPDRKLNITSNLSPVFSKSDLEAKNEDVQAQDEDVNPVYGKSPPETAVPPLKEEMTIKEEADDKSKFESMVNNNQGMRIREK